MQAICERHGAYEAQEMDIFGVHIMTKCPVCIDEESADTEARLKESIARSEEARRQRERESLIARGIEPEFFEVTWDSYKPETPEEHKALEACRKLERGEIKKLVLLGPNGCGKTMLATILARELGGIRLTVFELSARIRRGFRDGLCELDVLDSLLEYPIVILDEMGRTKGSEAELNWLSYLIDKCHVRGIRLLIISNKQMSRSLPQGRKADAFEYSLPDDAISRLRQETVIVEVKGRDRRSVRTAI